MGDCYIKKKKNGITGLKARCYVSQKYSHFIKIVIKK
jgi:hypothetical protein